jgi:hypothetical protein
LFVTSATLTYFAVKAWYQTPADDEQASALKEREALNSQHGEIRRNMSPDAKEYMETEKKMQVKAYNKAYDNLTLSEMRRYEEVLAKIKANRDDEREFMDGLTPEQRKAVRSPPSHDNIHHMEVEQSVRDRLKAFVNTNLELEGQIPDKIKNIELDPADKDTLLKMRAHALTTMGVSGDDTFNH